MIAREVRFGPHTIRLEPPDLIVVTAVGMLEAEHVHGVIAEMHDFGRKHPKPFILLDATRLVGFHPEARKAGMSLEESAHGRAFAIVGAGFKQRVLVTLLVKALTLLKKVAEPPMAFFDTEAEARAWFEGWRH